MSTLNKAQLVDEIIAKIISGSSNTTAQNLRIILNDYLDSYPNLLDGGYLFESELGYKSAITVVDGKAFLSLSQAQEIVVAAVSGVDLTPYFKKDGSIPMEGDIDAGGNGLDDVGNITGDGWRINFETGEIWDADNVLISNSYRTYFDQLGAQIFRLEDGLFRLGPIGTSVDIDASLITEPRSRVEPDKDGTYAMTSDIATAVGGATPTEIGYLSGSVSNIQNQINSINIGYGGGKPEARVITTANIALSGIQTIDGVLLVAGDRVVVNAQTTGTQNGIYVVAVGAWARATDASTGGSSTSSTSLYGAIVQVAEGTANHDTLWGCDTDAPITIGSTNISFTKLSSTTYTASDGVSLSGNNFILNNAYFSGEASMALGVITLLASAIFSKAIASWTPGAGTIANGDALQQVLQKLSGNIDLKENALTAPSNDSIEYFWQILNGVRTYQKTVEAYGVSTAVYNKLISGTATDWINGKYIGTASGVITIGLITSSVDSNPGQKFPSKDLTNLNYYLYECFPDGWYRTLRS